MRKDKDSLALEDLFSNLLDESRRYSAKDKEVALLSNSSNNQSNKNKNKLKGKNNSKGINKNKLNKSTNKKYIYYKKQGYLVDNYFYKYPNKASK